MGKVAQSTQNFTSSKIVIAARPPLRRGRTSSTANAVPLPLKGKAGVRIKILCQHNKGNTHRRCEIEFRPSKFVFRGNARRRRDHRNANFAAMPAAGAAEISPHQKLLLRLARPFSAGAPHPTRFARHLPLKGKASLRIKILCQHNKGKAKLHSDHRNANFAVILTVGAVTPAAGATIGIRISRQYPP